jgi:1-acyl-sn-glycerol-3-phosphate acyltransferase
MTMINLTLRSMESLMTWLRNFYEFTALYFCAGVFAFCVLFSGVLGRLLYPFLSRRQGARAGRYILHWMCKIVVGSMKYCGIVKFDLSELDKLDAEESVIIAPNHPSLLDAVLVISRLTNVVCIMKASLRENIFLGGGTRLARYIDNDSAGDMVRDSVAELHSGCQLLVFPEGTRTAEKPVNEFKNGFALIGLKANVPLQTVFIETNSAFLGKHWPGLQKPAFPLVYTMRLGKRFEMVGDRRELVGEIETYFREQLSMVRAD